MKYTFVFTVALLLTHLCDAGVIKKRSRKTATKLYATSSPILSAEEYPILPPEEVEDKPKDTVVSYIQNPTFELTSTPIEQYQKYAALFNSSPRFPKGISQVFQSTKDYKPICGPVTLTFAPVCGTDGKTYLNAQAALYANCLKPNHYVAIAYPGVCDNDDFAFNNNKCPAVTMHFAPVCGTDNVTYVNVGAVENENCERGLEGDFEIRVKYAGVCKEPLYSETQAEDDGIPILA